MSALYGKVIADHAKNPRNQGALATPDISHEGVNPLCGDRVTIELELTQGRISAARFRGEACMVALAGASVLTELVQGLTLGEAAALSSDQLLSALQATLRPSRINCATLALAVLRAGIGHRRSALD